MNDLDKKLQALDLEFLSGVPVSLTNGMIEQIKQAFKDAGYMKLDVLEAKLTTAMDNLDKNIRAEHKCMTGQEWYDRFTNFFNAAAYGNISIDDLYHIFDATAKKVSGIE